MAEDPLEMMEGEEIVREKEEAALLEALAVKWRQAWMTTVAFKGSGFLDAQVYVPLEDWEN